MKALVRIQSFALIGFLLMILCAKTFAQNVTSAQGAAPSSGKVTTPGNANLAAVSKDSESSEEEKQYKIKAKQRLYPGGKDEENLKVQSQLPTPTRKMTPVLETTMEDLEPAEEDAHD